ncbi:MAG: ABC transporter substrate-binding protein [Planctomycetota bacterium]|jgi:branched-chain amino acid transport system substrate-binding protein|nr:ABC transporter substrate-binding protein [Planctomycetota bacterium]
MRFTSAVRKVSLGMLFLACLWSASAVMAQDVIKIGVLGVMSGPAASWGLVNRYCAEASANMINAQGGFEIGGKKYKIEIVSIDDRNDPKVAVSGAERLIHEEGIRYIIGPNIDPTSMAIVPTIEKGAAISIPYAFSKKLFTPPAKNSILGMIASYQAGPVIYKYLQDKRGIKSIAFVARNDSESLNQRDEGVLAAKALNLNIVAASDSYETGTTDFFPVMSSVVSSNPDLLVISGAAPADTPLLIRAARELGFKGIISTETAQDAKVISELAGDLANGFISVGGASTPAIRSSYMEEFIKNYEKVAGEWNDEAGTKVYALEIILNTIKAAGPAALTDISLFMKAIDTFSMPNPYLKDNRPLRYVGLGDFTQRRQISVPMVVTEYQNGDFQTLFVGEVAN